MEITEEELRELMLTAFRAGRKTYLCKDIAMKLWVADETEQWKIDKKK